MKQQRKRGAIFVEDQAVVKDQIPLNKKKKIVAEVKPQEAVPDEKECVADSELQNSPMFPESDEEDEDDFLDDIMPMTNKCNLDIVYKELQKEPKFKNVTKWLKGIKGDVILPTLEPVVQAIVPGFVSTEAEGKLGAVSKLPEFVPPESMGNFGEILERVRGYLDLFRLKVWEMLEWVASYLNLFPLKLWDILERVPSYLDLVPHSD